MLKREHRFHGYNALNYTYKQGKQVRAELFGVRYVLNPRRERYRVAVVVSKKVHKSAVVRNRIRRRMYEVIRQQTTITQPFDIIVTVFTPAAAMVAASELAEQVNRLLKKAGVVL